MYLRNTARLAALGLLSFILVACGGSSSSTSCASVNANCSDPVQSFNAMGTDGPMAFAIVELFRLSDYLINPVGAPNLLAASARSGANGNANALQLVQSDSNNNPPGAGPFVLQVRIDGDPGTTLTRDTTTGAEPVITSVRTIITAADWASRKSTTPERRFYATPLTTIGLEQAIARAASATTAAVETAMPQASADVLQAFGFGLEKVAPAVNIFNLPPVLDISTQGDLAAQQNVAKYRVAIEAFAAIVASVKASESVTAQQVIAAVAADMGNDPMAYVGENSGNATVDALVAETATVSTNYLTSKGRLPAADGSTNVEQLLDGELSGNATLAGAINTDPEKADFDDDGSPNDVDSDNYDPASSADSDDDGVDDSVDNCPNTPNGAADASNQLDNDGDAVPGVGGGDACDNDADGDGVEGDGMGGPGTGGPGFDDVDDLDNTIANDPDGDGIDSSTVGNRPPLNGPDNCPNDFNPGQENYDAGPDNTPGTPDDLFIGGVNVSDALGNVCDPDGDGDSFEGPFASPPGPENAMDDLDENAFPGETDGDGVADADDNCPGTPNGTDIDPGTPGIQQAAGSTNAFGKAEPFGTACDPDDDGFPDTADEDIVGTLGEGVPVDNCPGGPGNENPGQENNDSALGDTLGDVCDPDDDNDSIPDTADPQPTVAVSSYHFDLFYTQQSSAGSDFQLATKSESVLQVGLPTIDTTSNGLDLGTDEQGDGNFNITSEYETIENTLDFVGTSCTPGSCFSTAGTSSPSAAPAPVTADVSPLTAYVDPTLNFGATTLLPWGSNSFVGAGRIPLVGVGAPLGTPQEYGLAALQYTDTLSDEADLNGIYGFVDMTVSYAGGLSTDNALVSTQSRVFDATFDGAGLITASGAMSQFDASVGTADGTVTYTNDVLGNGTYSFNVNNSGATTLTFAGDTLTGIADAAGELVALSNGSQRGYAVKLGTAATKAELVAALVAGSPFSLEGLVINAERDKIEGISLEGATLTFTDAGSGNMTAQLSLIGETARGVSTFDANNDNLPTVAAGTGLNVSVQSQPFSIALNGRFDTIGFGLGTATKRFDIEGFFVPNRGLLLRYIESAIAFTGAAGSQLTFGCATAASQTWVDPATSQPLVPQPTGTVCGFYIEGTGGSDADRLSDLARLSTPTPQQFTAVESSTGNPLSGNDGFAQGIVWGAPQ